MARCVLPLPEGQRRTTFREADRFDRSVMLKRGDVRAVVGAPAYRPAIERCARYEFAVSAEDGSLEGVRMSVAVVDWSVQPRACGERIAKQLGSYVKAGSAPRVRGTEGSERSIAHAIRFSPARAGNGLLKTQRGTVRPV